MIVVLAPGCTKDELAEIIRRIEDLGLKTNVMYGVERTVIGCLGDEREKGQLQALESLEFVERVIPILTPYKLAARQYREQPSVIKISENFIVGGNNIPVIAGPCSVESEEQIVQSAKIVKAAGANALRGGAFKPRSSTWSFQGLGEEGLKLLKIAKQETGLPIVTEILDHSNLDMFVEYADVLQVGARNMQNYALLRSLGKAGKPILLKRGMMATVEEFLSSAEYILAAGNPDVILCERGIRTFETATRNTLDLNCIPAVQERSHLPIIVDPSHGTGVWRYVAPMSKAAIAGGASGLIIEMHPKPQEAVSDGYQSLTPTTFSQLMDELEPIAAVFGKTVGTRPARYKLTEK